MSSGLTGALQTMPLIAILRGLQSARAATVTNILVNAGFRVIEVPLNGAGAFEAISEVRRAVSGDIVVGAGTVLTPLFARQAQQSGAEFLVMPNLNSLVMEEGRRLGLPLIPGVMTPSEAFGALDMGAFALKLFPADVVQPQGLKALRSVMPKGQGLIYPVSGIEPHAMKAWFDAGADGVGIGGSLFKPGYSDTEILQRAESFVAEWRVIKGFST